MQIEKTVSFWNCQRISAWEATIKDSQLGSHCSDTCLSLFQCCFIMVFGWNCLKFEANIERDVEKEVEDNMSTLFVQLTLSSKVTDCSLNVVIKLKLFIFIFHHVLKWCHFCLLCQNKTKLARLDWILVFLKYCEALVSRCLWYCLYCHDYV